MFEEHAELLAQWPWQWYCTLSLPESFGKYPTARDLFNYLVRGWIRPICVEQKIQVAGAFLFCWKQGVAHIHGLMLGRNRHGKTLADVSRTTWRDRWPHPAKVEEPKSQEAVVKYVSCHFLHQRSDRARLEFYNTNLLSQTRD